MDFLARGMLLAAADISAGNVSILAPASPETHAIVNLAVLTGAIFLLILAVVEGVLLYNLWRFRSRRPEPNHGSPEIEPAQVYGSEPIEIAWTAAPSIIVFFLLLVITRTLWEVKAGDTAIPLTESDLQVRIIGRQWWWKYVYETYQGRTLGIVTANELHIPVSDANVPRRTRLVLESADVCHSFWIPRLAGKLDLIPGRVNTLWLETAETGTFLGQCAEYCGTQHAGMLLRVIVDTPEEFERWLENQSKDAVDDPAARVGRDAFLAQSCVNCHRIRGTIANGSLGPDLTHLMSRGTLASGLLENTRDNLVRWVHDPQAIKPGCLMPAFGLTEREENEIVRYLFTLR